MNTEFENRKTICGYSSQNIFKVLFLIIVLYFFIHLLSFWQTPLGQEPVLDGAENVALAQKILSNNLPEEPFYRAMGYPFFLSLLFKFGANPENIMQFVGISGLIFHLVNTLLVTLLAGFLWENVYSSLFVLLIYGLNPLVVYFAVDPLDITMGLTFALGSFYLFLQDSRKDLSGLLAGIVLGIGSLIRANVLPLAGIFVLTPFLFKQKKRMAMFAFAGLLITIIGGGIVNLRVGGQFRLLPWQGAYNLYSANKSGANGRYYKQTIYLPDRQLSRNPGRLESEILYQKENKSSNQNFSIDKFNAYWRNRTLSDICSNPKAWIYLYIKKVFYLFNNFEQYNNKTFSFHKALIPTLRYNPICWALIFVMAGMVLGLHNTWTRKFKLLCLAICLLSIGILGFYVSARFRMLLVPFVTILASGVFLIDKQRLFGAKSLVILIALSFLTFNNFFDAKSTDTYVSDMLLMAQSSARINDYNQQFEWAGKALELDPQNINGIRLRLVGFTNMVLTGDIRSNLTLKSIEKELDFVIKNDINYEDIALIKGCYVYKVLNDKIRGWTIWKNSLLKNQANHLLRGFLAATGCEGFEADASASKINPILWYAYFVNSKDFDPNNPEYAKIRKILEILVFRHE